MLKFFTINSTTKYNNFLQNETLLFPSFVGKRRLVFGATFTRTKSVSVVRVCACVRACVCARASKPRTVLVTEGWGEGLVSTA